MASNPPVWSLKSASSTRSTRVISKVVASGRLRNSLSRFAVRSSSTTRRSEKTRPELEGFVESSDIRRIGGPWLQCRMTLPPSVCRTPGSRTNDSKTGKEPHHIRKGRQPLGVEGLLTCKRISLAIHIRHFGYASPRTSKSVGPTRSAILPMASTSNPKTSAALSPSMARTSWSLSTGPKVAFSDSMVCGQVPSMCG